MKVCHTQTNRNGSHISDSNMEKAMPTLKYRPILAYIHELEDGTKDFYAHNMEIVENEDGESEINYIEKQVGCFTADDPWLEYDKDMDKTYVMAYAVIPEDYTEAADIIRRKNGSKGWRQHLLRCGQGFRGIQLRSLYQLLPLVVGLTS